MSCATAIGRSLRAHGRRAPSRPGAAARLRARRRQPRARRGAALLRAPGASASTGTTSCAGAPSRAGAGRVCSRARAPAPRRASPAVAGRRRRRAPGAGRAGAALAPALSRLPVVGVTGSNGKTTTKELLRRACSPAGRRVRRTTGATSTPTSALPLTILGSSPTHRGAVLEMGMSAPGRDRLPRRAVASPTSASITNRAGAPRAARHPRRGRAAKGELLRHGWPPRASRCCPRRRRCSRPGRAAGVPRLASGSFGTARATCAAPCSPSRAARPASMWRSGLGGREVRAACRGRRHNARNAAAAAAAARALGVPTRRPSRAGSAAARPAATARRDADRAGRTSSTTATTRTRPRCVGRAGGR